MNDNVNSLKSYHGLDIGKLVCAVLVVSIHTEALKTYGPVLNYGLKNYFARVSVPFFFLCSGFLLFRKMSYEHCDYRRILQYALKILRLYIIWSIIYAPLRLYSIIKDHPKGYIHSFLSYIRDLVFVGGYTQLWYLNATVVAVVIIAIFLYKRYSVKSILITAAVLYVIGLLPQTYFAVLKPLRNYETVLIMMNLTLKDSPVYSHLRELSSLIFYGHLLAAAAVNKGLDVLGDRIGKNLDNSLMRFLLILAVSSVCSELIIRLSSRQRFSWLKKLYS